MRIGFVSASFRPELEKWVHGIYIRMGMFIEALKDLGELDMLYYVDHRLPVSEDYVRDVAHRMKLRWQTSLRLTLCRLEPSRPLNGRWQALVSPALSIYNHNPYSRIVGREQIEAFRQMLSRNPDLVFAHRLIAMCAIMRSGGRLPPIYFDIDDVEHVAFARSIKSPPWWPAKRLRYLQAPSILLGERRAVRTAHKAFVCSEKDRKYLRGALGLANVVVIPNAVEFPKRLETTVESKLLFMGNYEYHPNTVAANYLIEEIWPLIRSAVPDAGLLIVGEGPENIPCFTKRPLNVKFWGFAESLDDVYRRTRAVCCPILSGGGTRIKILEAGAYGKPVVSTTIGAEGLNLKEGREIFLRDDPASFAEACVKLLQDRDLAEKMGRAARSAIAEEYDRQKIIGRIRESLAGSHMKTVRDGPNADSPRGTRSA